MGHHEVIIDTRETDDVGGELAGLCAPGLGVDGCMEEAFEGRGVVLPLLGWRKINASET